MKIVCINPNTTESITARVLDVCRNLAPPSVSFTGATGRFGARYITNRASSAIAGHAALDCYASHGQGADGVLLACFGDPGLLALKEIAAVPVIGLAEASCHMAAGLAQRFTIITGGHRWGPMLDEFAAGMGLRSRLASVRTVAPTGGDIHRDPQAAYALLAAEAERAVTEDGAEAVILAGAGLAGIAPVIQPSVRVPVICSVAAGLHMLMAQIALGAARPSAGSLSFPGEIETVGLSPDLATLLAPAGRASG